MKKTNTYEVKLHIGSIRGYHGEAYGKWSLINKISEFQKRLSDQLACSVRVTPTTFVFKDYVEEGWEIVAANYPRFPKKKEQIKEFMQLLAQYLMKELEQNRITVTEPKKSIMFESENAEQNP